MSLTKLPRWVVLVVLPIAIPWSPSFASRATAAPQEVAATIDGRALRMSVSAAKVREFYVKNGWRPIWSASAVRSLEQALADRKRHGLDRVEFLVETGLATSDAERETARTGAALRYAAALAHGGVDPASLHEIYTLTRPAPDLAAGLARAVRSNDLVGWLDGLAPQDAEYRQLSQAYLHYSNQAASTTGEEIAATGLIHVGDTDPRVPAIVTQLTGSGYLSGGVIGGSTTPANDMAGTSPATLTAPYTEVAATAIRQLQRDYGITDDGVIGPDTLKVLNLGPGDRARALAVALERRRWLSRTPPATRIDVNTAAANLRYFREGQVVDSRKVIVGKPGNETPALMAPIYRLVANPTWTVPKSIQNGELAHVGPDYLSSHNMVMRGGWIVQQPGADNALGLVKFDMQDDQAIYLHDTSSPALFDRSQRHLSHGCVRVEDALGFAQRIAEVEGVADKWQQATQSGEPTFVPLPRRIPVRLLYHNVFVDDAGQIAFRTDPYGWNDAVAQALGFGTGPTRKADAASVDIGP